MNNTKEHQQLVDDILFAVGSLQYVRVWPRIVGFDHKKKLKYGINGESDIQGVLAPYGRILAIEVKTGSGKLSSEQTKWRDMIEKFGGLYIEARSVSDVMTAIAQALR